MKLFVANLKMNLSIAQQQKLAKEYKKIASKSSYRLVFCPTFTALPLLKKITTKGDVALGAQSCSPYHKGAHTGQVSASELYELACSYVIIGHSEERTAYRLPDNYIFDQIMRVLENGMIPILCIGETKEERDAGQTLSVLEKQLKLICDTIPKASLYIAYEPLWAISTGEIPQIEELEELISRLKWMLPYCAFLYGGSVNHQTVESLNTIPQLSGFLIGHASLDFQEVKKIVVYKK